MRIKKLTAKIPNTITITRIFAGFLLIWLYQNQYLTSTFFLAIIIAVGDFFDGFLARRLNAESELGAKLDPVADKIFVLSLVTALFFAGQIPWYYLVLVWFRDIAQLSSFPLLLVVLKIPFKVAPNWWPKLASALNYLVIILAILKSDLRIFNLLGMTFFMAILWSSLLLEVYILIDYFWQLKLIIQKKSDTFR